MKQTTFDYTTVTAPDALLGSVGERVDEFNATQGDRRARLTLKDSDPEKGTFTLRVREGAAPESSLDLAVTVTPHDGGAAIRGELTHDPADGTPTFGSRLYGLFVAGFARLTVLTLFYGILLGVSFLFPGRNFWVPAIPPAILLVWMTVRAITVRRRLPRRVDRFFTDFCGAKKADAPASVKN
ncbi:MAG: hypothetical protein J6Z04_07745 [Clostridia bacterium]|nr:hypothetical protein [Clostridia bacterium]